MQCKINDLYMKFYLLLLPSMWWTTRLEILSETNWLRMRVFWRGFMLENNNDCVIMQLYLLSDYSGDTSPEWSNMQRWQNISKFRTNFRRCGSEIFTKLINNEYITWNIPEIYLWNKINPTYRTPLRMTCVVYGWDAYGYAFPKNGGHFSIFAWCVRSIYAALRNPLS